MMNHRLNQDPVMEKLIARVMVDGKRSKAEKIVLAKIESKGYILQNKVNKKTDLLIVENLDLTSSKMKKAKELNIKIITNEIFISEY